MLEIRSEIYADSGILVNWDGRIIRTAININECFPLWLAIFEENYFTARNWLQIFQRFVDFVLVFVVQMTFELYQRLQEAKSQLKYFSSEIW